MPDFREDSEENRALQLQYAYGVDKPNLGRTPDSLVDRVSVQPPLTLSTRPPEDTAGNPSEKSTIPAPLPPPPIEPPIESSGRSSQQKISEQLRYPNQEIHENTDYLQIAIVGYRPVAQNNNGSLVGRPGSRRNGGKERFATILLPIPSNVQDGNSVSYSDSSLNALTAALAGGSMSIMEDLPAVFSGDKKIEDLKNDLKTRITDSGLNLDVVQDLITKQLSASAAGVFGGNLSINQLLSREEGTIFNPNMELLFNGPTLRSFRFSFKMTPRNKDESKMVRRIINTLKRNMAPQVTTSGDSQNLFLKTPNVFELTYKQRGQPHSFLHRFKQCFLENMSVNYTGEGTYATYGDGTPISMVMDLQFKELEPIYDIDYEQTENNRYNGVGY